MITWFLFDVLPAWLRALGRVAREGALYRGLAALWQRCAGALRESFCARLWAGCSRLQQRESLLCRWADGLILWLRDFAGKLLGWVVEPLTGSRMAASLCRMPRYSFAWLYGLVFLLCFLCPHGLWQDSFGPALGGLLFTAMLLDAWNQGRRPFRVRNLGLWFFAFFLAAGFSVLTARNNGEALRVFWFYLAAALFAAGAVGTVTNRGRLMSILGFVYLTLLLTALYAVFQRFQGVAVSAALTDLKTNAGMPGRVYSTLENPNNYAEFIVLTFPVSLVFCANIVDRRWKTLCTASLAVPVVALLMTYSRSGWVSFALAAVVFIALWEKRLLPLLIPAAAIALPLLPDSVFNRILTIGSTADSSNAYRLFIWASVLKMIRDWGLTGIGLGPGNFIPLYAFYSTPTARTAYHSHMLYLQIWLEMGLPGIVSFLMLHLGVMRRGIRAMAHADPLLRHVLTAAISSLAGISFAGAAEYIWYYPRLLYAFFILVGITLAAVKLAEESR